MAALGCAPLTVTGRLRITVTMVWTLMDVGWGTGARIRQWVDARNLQLAVVLKESLEMATLALALEAAMNHIQRSVTALKSPVTLDSLLKAAGMATTASHRYLNGMVALVSAL